MSASDGTGQGDPLHPLIPESLSSPEETREFGGLENLPTDITSEFHEASDIKSGSGIAGTSSGLNFLRGGPQGATTRLVGEYRLDEMLGEGGMGRVFKARDPNGRPIAIKLLSPKWTTSPEALVRFKQEGYIASQINHPHCVFVHRVDEERGVPYIAMELMTGQTLKDLVAQRGPLPYKEAVRLILQCIDGLIEAHAQGMIHRDIKPANCYLDEHGNVKIGDFGLARSLVDDSNLTRTGAFLGTPLYASPEQVLGQPIDVRSDIYSLSATLYCLLAGKAPFESPNAAQVIAKIASSDPPPFRELGIDVPRGLETIVMKGLARDQSKRFDTFQRMRLALLPIVAPDEEISPIPRRILAQFIDSTVLSFLMAGVVISVVGSQHVVGINPLLPNLMGWVISFLYFWGLEAAFGVTLGKRLTRLKVVDVETGNRQSLGRLGIRTLVFLTLTNSLETLYYLTMRGGLAPGIAPLVSWSSAIIGYLAMLATWWRTGNRQLLHEWLSCTVTRISKPTRSLVPVQLSQPNWALPCLPWNASSNEVELSRGGLNHVGRFQIRGRLPTIDGTCWLVGQDAALKRDVWIHLRPQGATPLSDERKKCGRRTRMRIIDSGVLDQQSWDAYLAPDGVPLSVFVETGQTIPWPIARQVFRQLLVEESITTGDRIEHDQWSASRFWVDPNGRITFSDADVLNEKARSKPCFTELLKQVALAALPCAHRMRKAIANDPNSKSRLPSIAELAPYRAMKLLEKTAREGIEAATLVKELDRVDQASEQMTSAMRLTHALSLTVVFSPVILMVLLLLSVNTAMTVRQLHNELRHLVNLSAVLKDTEKYAPLLSNVNQDDKEKWFTDERRSRVESAIEAKMETTKGAFDSIGVTERLILAQMGLTRDVVQMRPPVQAFVTQVKLADSPQSSYQTIRITPEVATGIPMGRDTETAANFHDLISPMKVWEGEIRIVRSRPIGLPKVFLIEAAILGLWAGLLRGGVVQIFTGTCVVRRDGCRAGFFRCLWRAIVWMMPFVVTLFAILNIEANGPEWLGTANQLKRLFIALPVVYLVSTVFLPQVAPHDKLSYTAVVPR